MPGQVEPLPHADNEHGQLLVLRGRSGNNKGAEADREAVDIHRVAAPREDVDCCEKQELQALTPKELRPIREGIAQGRVQKEKQPDDRAGERRVAADERRAKFSGIVKRL